MTLSFFYTEGIDEPPLERTSGGNNPSPKPLGRNPIWDSEVSGLHGTNFRINNKISPVLSSFSFTSTVLRPSRKYDGSLGGGNIGGEGVSGQSVRGVPSELRSSLPTPGDPSDFFRLGVRRLTDVHVFRTPSET